MGRVGPFAFLWNYRPLRCGGGSVQDNLLIPVLFMKFVHKKSYFSSDLAEENKNENAGKILEIFELLYFIDEGISH